MKYFEIALRSQPGVCYKAVMIRPFKCDIIQPKEEESLNEFWTSLVMSNASFIKAWSFNDVTEEIIINVRDIANVRVL